MQRDSYSIGRANGYAECLLLVEAGESIAQLHARLVELRQAAGYISDAARRLAAHAPYDDGPVAE